jgi:hypothetical protein
VYMGVRVCDVCECVRVSVCVCVCVCVCCLALMVSAAVVAGSRHHACTNQGTVKRLGSTAKGKNAKYTGVLSLTHTRELAVAPIGYPVAGTREFY